MIFPMTSKKPVFIAGNGVRLADAAGLMNELIEKTDIPALTTMNAVDLLQDQHHIGFFGIHGNRIANTILEEADVVIAIGAKLGIRQVGHYIERWAPKAKLIRVDIDPYELKRDIKPDEQKHNTNAKDFIAALLLEDIPKYTQWKDACISAKNILAAFDRDTGNEYIEKISSLLPESPIVAVDVGQNQVWSAQSLNLKGKDGRILIGGGYGSMGCGLPYAIGAAIAHRENPVFCITGDGGLQMNIQELQVLAREQLPVKVFVLNNAVLGKISEAQTMSFGSRFICTTASSGYTVPDFRKIAEAYGITSTTVQTPEELDEYSEWLKNDQPCLFNLLLPQNTKLYPKIDWESGETIPKLDQSVMDDIRKILREA